ncbi:MAG: aminotransferase class IV [Lentisphaeria bacterium]|nr:aminotransferase class IV [Lentisphaeria bacterium]
MSDRLVYFNGNFIPEEEARISIFDSALMFGDMLFEMTRTFNHKPFRLGDHLDRLYSSLKYARIDCGLTIDEMEAATTATLEKNLAMLDGIDCQIMHNVTRGALNIYEDAVREGLAPIVTINVFPLIQHLGNAAPKYTEGGHSVVTPQQAVPSRYIDPKAKNRSRIYYKLAELQANQLEDGAQALLTDERGFVAEGTGNNFFMTLNGRVLTPKGHNILRGVSRMNCMELCDKLGIGVEEADIEPYDVREADEAWITSTTFCMLPVTRFNFQPVGDGQVGPIYTKLLNAWSEQVDCDIKAQAEKFEGILKAGAV